jgi:hypothetical protein
MAGPGRPKSDRPTRGVRIFDDTAEMLGWVLDLEDQGETFAEFIDDMIRREVENRFAPLAARVATIKAARSGAAAAQDEGPVLSNSLDGEGR